MPNAVYPPPIRRASSWMCSTGKGGEAKGARAMDRSFRGLSSPATRLELRAPHRRHR